MLPHIIHHSLPRLKALRPQEGSRIFAWAHGIISSPRAYAIAQHTNVRMQETRFLEGFGFELAESARTAIADSLNADPKNVFFATSSSRALPYFMRALGNLHGPCSLLFSEEEMWATTCLLEGKDEYFSVLTLPNYGIKTNFQPLYFPKRSLGTRILASFDEEDILKKAHEVSGPLVVLVSHVGRVTGRIMDVARLSRELATRNDPTYLLVDGNLSFLAEPIDVSALNLAGYIAGSSKTVGGEPVIGFAYIRPDALGALELSLSEGIAFQFAPKTGFERGTDASFWISLPELATFAEFLPEAQAFYANETHNEYKAWLEANLPAIKVQNYNRWNYVVPESSFFLFLESNDHSEFSVENLQDFLETRGIIITPMPRNYSHKKTARHSLRISWGPHNTQEDLEALADALGQYPGWYCP